MSKELKKYYREINNKMLNCPRKKRVSLLRSLKLDIDNYLAETPNVTIHDVRKKFGTPDMIAEAFLQNGNIAETDRQFNSRKIIVRIVLVATAILLLAVLIWGTIYIMDDYAYAHGYVVEEAAKMGTEFTPPEGVTSWRDY